MTHVSITLDSRKNKQNGNRRVLIKLHKQFQGICQRCKAKTVIPKSGGKNIRDDIATIQHHYDRHDIRRYCIGGERAITLFCNKCNRTDDAEMKAKRNTFYFNSVKPYANTNINITSLLTGIKIDYKKAPQNKGGWATYKEAYEMCKRKTKETGIQHEVIKQKIKGGKYILIKASNKRK